MTAPPTFAYRRIASFPSLELSASATPSSAHVTTGRPCVIHFYNAG